MNDSFLIEKPRIFPETDWAFGILVLVLTVYVVSRLLFPRYHARIAHAFFNRYEATKLIEEKNVLFNRGGFLLNLVPLFCIAMIVYSQMGYFNPERLLSDTFLKYMRILGAVTAFYGIRVLVIYLFGYFFEKKEIALRFNQIWFLQFENLGIFILIPSLVLPFTADIVQLVLMILLWIALVLWFGYTIVRELELLKSYRVSIFYMFLYLCTLEILPVWWALQSITEGW
jgi:hypothetical protein